MSKQAVIDATGPLLRAQGVRMVYGDGQGEVVALQGVDLTLSLGETMAVVGASGAGKSTLLHILGGLDFPTSGEVWFEGRTLVRMSDKERTTLRNERIGFVYQFVRESKCGLIVVTHDPLLAARCDRQLQL